MSSLFFWNSWSRIYRLTYLIGLGLFLISSLALVVAWARGLGNVVRWDVLSELNELPITFHGFTDGLLDYTVGGKAYAVSEQFVASPMQVRPDAATVYLACILVAFVFIWSAVTRFDRIRYLVSTAVLILGLAFFRWEMLEVPGLGGNYLFLLLTFAFGSLSYYFHAFRPDFTLPVRCGAFGLLMVVVVAALGVLSPVPFASMTVVGYGMPVLLALSVGFIFFIATEIIAGLVWLTSAGRPDAPTPSMGGRRPLGLNNLLFISGLYLINLVLIWLKNTKLIDWDVLAISPFVLYLTSVTLGIWGFRRLTQQQDTVSFRDSGAYLYAGLALLTTLTMAYAFATANDPLTEMFEDVIVYTHLAMGLSFMAYVLINFWPVYRQRLPIYRILYKPKRLELSLFRVAGVFGFLVLLASGGLITFRQSVAGYYNGLGDLYAISNEPNSANAFYQLALEQEFQNHKSNYALASLALAQNNQTAAAFYFQQATLKQPHPHDYAGLSQTFLQTDLFFEAVKTLQRGIRVFPNSGELQNNLGYLYARTSIADSAYYYLKSATGTAARSEIPESNLLAFYARNPKVLAADSTLAQNTAESTYESYQANALALRLVAQRNLDGGSMSQDSQLVWLANEKANEGLSVGRFASLYNFALAHQRPDSVLTQTLQRRSADPVNQDFTDDLLLARAVAEYRRHNHPTAFGLMSQLAEGDQQNGSAYRSMLGLWLLEQGLYQRSADTFGYNTDTTSIYYRAVALTKAGDLAVAQSLWETAAKNDSAIAALKDVLYDQRKPATDLEKAFYVNYRLDDPNRGQYWETIRDVDLKTTVGAFLAGQYLDQGQWHIPQNILLLLPKTNAISPFAQSVRNLAALQLAVVRRNVKAAVAVAGQPVLPQHEAARLFLLGRAYEQSKQFVQARQYYRRALERSPLTAWIVVPAAELIRRQKQSKQAYDLVLTALPFNETDANLLKTYVNLCLDLSLFDYAQNGLAKLQAVAAPADYQAFLTAYQEKLASIEKARQKFVE